MTIFLGIVIILLGGFATWREVQYRKGAPPPDERLQGEIDKLHLEIVEKDQQHYSDKLEIEGLHREELSTVRGQVANRIHELELDWAEHKRADRKASNARSRSMLVAKIAEHMAPMLKGFPFNPKDVRHVGELFDYLVLDGLEDGEIRQVVFLEIKTRASGRVSNPREKMLRDAIDAGHVRYEVYVPKIPKVEE